MTAHPIQSRRVLAEYLSAHGLNPSLADGPVGARFLASGAASPAEALGRWFAGVLHQAPGEAESLGWIAFLLAEGDPRDLLGELPDGVAARMRSLAPIPAFETPLAMPAAVLDRPRRRRARGGLPAQGRAA